MDGDQDLDFVASDRSGGITVARNDNIGSGTLEIVENNGDATFASKQTQFLFDGPTSLATTDVDGDGNSDLIFTNSGNNTVSILPLISPIRVGGKVFRDLNANGIDDDNAGGAPNVTVYVDADQNGLPDDRRAVAQELDVLTVAAGASIEDGTGVETTVQTTADGDFVLTGLDPGTLAIGVLPPPGFSPTAPASGTHTFTVAQGDVVSNQNFGLDSTLGRINGTKWEDKYGDMVFDANEPGISDWVIYLDDNANGQLDGRLTVADEDVPAHTMASSSGTLELVVDVAGLSGNIADVNVSLDATHDEAGFDLIVRLRDPGQQLITLHDQSNTNRGANFTQTIFDDEADEHIGFAAAPFTGSFRPIDALSEFNGRTPDGLWKLEVRDVGTNALGTINSWSITITTDQAEAFTVTNSDGDYTIFDVPPGDVAVAEQMQPTFAQAFPAAPGTHTFTVSQRSVHNGIHFGNQSLNGEIRGTVVVDSNQNGVADDGEVGVPNVSVYLDLNTDGSHQGDVEPLMMTDEDGKYSFADLPPDTYVVGLKLPDLDPPLRVTGPAARTVELEACELAENEDFTLIQLATIRGIVKESGEDPLTGLPSLTPLAGVDVFLDLDGDGKNLGEPTAATQTDDPATPEDETGMFRFEELDPRAYSVALDLASRFRQLEPTDRMPINLVVAAGLVSDELSFTVERAEVFGTVYDDDNRDGVFDATESGVVFDAFELQLDIGDDGSLDRQVFTDILGDYQINDVGPGTRSIILIETLPYIATTTPFGEKVVFTVPEDPTLAVPLDFGVFHPPDLVVKRMPMEEVVLGQTVEVTYEVGAAGPGSLAPNDEWQEELWITDDGFVDGNGFESLISDTTHTAVGVRTVSVNFPNLGTPSPADPSIVSQGMLNDGLFWNLFVDPLLTNDADDFGAVIEVDNVNNNKDQLLIDVALPDIFVDEEPVPFRSPSIHLDATNRMLSASGDITYPVENLGAPIPPGSQWTEEIWIGTDVNVAAADDARNGVFHRMIGSTTATTAGNFTQRTVQVTLDAVKIPKGVLISSLQFIIVLDPVEPTEDDIAPPGDLLEKHEIAPRNPAPANNVRAIEISHTHRVSVKPDGSQQGPSNQPPGPADPPIDPGGTASGARDVPVGGVEFLGGGSRDMSLSADGRFVAFSTDEPLVPEDVNAGHDVYLHDRDVDEDGLFDEPGAVSTILVSEVTAQFPDAKAIYPSISANGNVVAYEFLVAQLGDFGASLIA